MNAFLHQLTQVVIDKGSLKDLYMYNVN